MLPVYAFIHSNVLIQIYTKCYQREENMRQYGNRTRGRCVFARICYVVCVCLVHLNAKCGQLHKFESSVYMYVEQNIMSDLLIKWLSVSVRAAVVIATGHHLGGGEQKERREEKARERERARSVIVV